MGLQLDERSSLFDLVLGTEYSVPSTELMMELICERNDAYDDYPLGAAPEC